MDIKCSCIVCRTKDKSKLDDGKLCPTLVKRNALMKFRDMNMKTDFSSTAPSVFVGQYGYPHVNVGFLTPPTKVDESWLYDAPRTWAQKNYGVDNVIDLRSGLVNSRFKSDIHATSYTSDESKKLLEAAKEASQASRPVELEISIRDKPKFTTNLDQYMAPTGPNALLSRVDITSNTRIDRQVDKRVSDTDMLSSEAIIELFKLGQDENFLSRLISMGNLGKQNKRKLVPTRWSITAVDDTLGKNMIEQVKDFEIIQPSLFFGGYLGNYYLIMIFEDNWQYELFETRVPDDPKGINDELRWATDHEGCNGRTEYASNTAGGYYAARLPILDWLTTQNKQGSVLVLRFITSDYSCPLGVWVVREATRKSINGKLHSFEDKEQMLNYARFITKKKFNYDFDNILKDSIIYKNIKNQVKLTSYFGKKQ